MFKNWDGTVLSTDIYHWGDVVTAPADPTKAADNTYTYAFVGWDKTVVNCAGSATYTATYEATYINYTVVFKNWDGTVLSTKTYHWGNAVTAPAEPARGADNTFTYTFTGWDPAVVDCNGNAVYTAQYSKHYIDYTVTFLGWDGKVIAEATYHYGDRLVLPPDPVKPADDVYTYAFVGWSPVADICKGNAVHTPVFTPSNVEYRVTFLDWDGTVLQSKLYYFGDAVTAPAAPTRDADETYTYTFTGWDKPVTNCSGETVYTAVYDAVYIEYTVEFKNWDGSVIASDTYHFGETVTPPQTPGRPADSTYTNTFAGWTPEYSDVCAGNTVYTATYQAHYIVYTVEFRDEDGSLITSGEYHYGDPVIPPEDPTKPADGMYFYTFSGWNQTVTDCRGDVVYTAQYTATKIVVTSISITVRPTKLNYTAGELLDLGGMKVTVSYNYGQPELITSGWEVSGYQPNVTGTQTVTVSYGGKTATFQVTVKSAVPDTITSTTYKVSGDVIRKIRVNTTASKLLNGIPERAFCAVYKADDSSVSATAVVGTGMTVKLKDGNTVKDTLTVVVTGDTNGDGKITITDMLAAKAHILKKNMLSGVFAMVGDTNGDGNITITDFIQLKAHILGKSAVVPN